MGMVYSDTKVIREKVVKPALHGGYILAPTTAQRLRYKGYLCVYGKDILNVSVGMKTLIEESHVCHLSSVRYSALSHILSGCHARLVE